MGLRNNINHTGFELLIDNWGSMEQWGLTGRRTRPQVEYLMTLCRRIDNYKAASYVNHNILGKEVLQGPISTDNTIDLDVVEAEDIMIENTIKSDANNSDVMWVPYVYLRDITNEFKIPIGKGGFSEVFKGLTRQSKIPLAIKKLNSNSDEERKIMNFEVEKMPSLRHRNIIELYGYSNHSTASPCLIYPFMENGTLSDMLKHDFQHPKYLNPKQRLDISKGIASGISYIHRVNTEPTKTLIHRDIKTSNILLDNEFTPKITDFGLLRLAVSGDDEESTRTVVCKGTTAYMPPEAYPPENDCSAKWDVYSLGVVLLEILTSFPVVDKERCTEDRKIMSRIYSHIEDHGSDSLKDLLDPCWDKENKVEIARSIYRIADSRCLVMLKKSRATSEQIVQELENI